MRWPFGSYQHTVAYQLSFSGYGVHSNCKVDMRIEAAPPGHGIEFICQFANDKSIKVSPGNVSSKGYCTILQKDGVSIRTVEHFLAACTGMGIDNLRVNISQDELPILDGSSLPFMLKFANAKLKQSAPKRYFLLRRKLKVEDGVSFIKVAPASRIGIDCVIEYEHPWFRKHMQALKCQMDMDLTSFENIGIARTFGFLADLPQLRQFGLAKGANLHNTVAFDDVAPVNPDGLRIENECVAHKVLDLIGDLSVLGAPVIANFTACRPGHRINTQLVREMVEQDLLVEVYAQGELMSQVVSQQLGAQELVK